MVALIVAVVGCFLGYAYLSLRAPPPKICGSPGGPSVTSPRIILSDGRHLAYKERVVSEKEAKYKIVVTHGFDDSKDFRLAVSEVVGSCTCSAFCKLLVALLSCPFIKRRLRDDACARSMDISNCALCSMDVLLVDAQNWFPSMSIMEGKIDIFSNSDLEIIKQLSEAPVEGQEKVRQQGAYECLHRDMMVAFG